MTQIGPIREALRDRLTSIEGLKEYDVATGVERTPAAIVFLAPPEGGRHKIDGCTEIWGFLIELHVPLAAGLPRAQRKIDGLISTTGEFSIKAAIYADKTLGGLVDTLEVRAFQRYTISELNGVRTILAQIPGTVWVTE